MYKWALTGAPLGYPVVVLWHGRPADLDLLAQQFIGSGNVGVGQFIALAVDLDASLVGQPTGVSGTMLVFTTQVSSPALLWPACLIQPIGVKPLSCSQFLISGSPTFTSPGSALLFQARCRALSCDCCRLNTRIGCAGLTLLLSCP